MLDLRQPYRSAEAAPRTAVVRLFSIIGRVANNEARRKSLRTPGLAPAHRSAFALTTLAAPAALSREEADEYDVAFTRAAALN